MDGSYAVTASAAGSSVTSFALTNTGPVLTNLIVNTTSSSLFPGGGLLSLPEAIALANAESAGSAQISFDSTVFSTPQTITLSGSQLELKNTGETETITGPAAGVTISGGGMSRVFLVDSGVTASISGLTISGGSVIGNGGGLANYGTATLTDCNTSGNYAASYNGGRPPSARRRLFNSGTANLTLTNCTVSGNSTGGGGGGVWNAGIANLTGCTLSGNITSFYGGGGLNNSGTADLTDCTFSGNYARYGGGLQNSGTANLTDCTISGNYAYSGGGIDNAGGTTTLTNTIVAGNSSGDIEGQVSGSNNLIGTGGSGGWSMVRMATSSASRIPCWPRWATTAGRPRPLPCSPVAPPSAPASRSRASPPTSAASRSTHPTLTSAHSRARASPSRPSPAAPRSRQPSARRSCTRWR